MAPSVGVGPGGGPSHKKAPFYCEGPPPGPLRRRVPPITVGPHPGSQYLAPALALGSGVGPGGGPSHKKAPFYCEGPPPGPLRRRVPPITVGPHPGSQYLAPALALGSPVLAPQGHPTSGYLVKSPLTISFASVRV